MADKAVLRAVMEMLADQLRQRHQSGASGTDEINSMVAQLFGRTETGERILAELAEHPADPARRSAAFEFLGEALSADPQAAAAIEEAVLAFLDTPPDDPWTSPSDELTEAKRRRLLLESMEFARPRPMAAASAFVQFFANFWPSPQRDIRKIEYIEIESADPAAWAILCDDGSSLIVIQSRVVEWLLFQAQLAWLAGAGAERTGCPSTKAGKIKLQAIYMALVRARRIDWRFGRFPGSLAVLMDGGDDYNTAMNEDFYTDSYLFILSHEIAHCVLGHANEQRSLFGWSRPVAVTARADPSEHEADRLAGEVLSQFAHGRADHRGSSPDYEYYSAWLGAISAVAAISFWESGMFIRLSGSHPPAAERLIRLKASFAERWRHARRLRIAGLDMLAAVSGLNAVIDGATRPEPLPESAWLAALSMPCLRDDERLRLYVAKTLDQVAWGGQSLEKVASSVDIPVLSASASRAEVAAYLSRLGVTQERQERLFDYGQPLMYSTAVDLVSSAPAFSSMESAAVQRSTAYSIVMQNIDVFSGSKP
jgi:hypothetical protein